MTLENSFSSRRLLARAPTPLIADASWWILVRLPAYAYRWSLKSTAWVWSALLWVVHPIRQTDDVRRFMNGIRNLAVSRWMWWYSLGVAILFLLKIYIYNFSLHWACRLEQYAAWSVAKHYALLDALPPWQIAAAINSGFTVWCFLSLTIYAMRWKRATNCDRSCPSDVSMELHDQKCIRHIHRALYCLYHSADGKQVASASASG